MYVRCSGRLDVLCHIVWQNFTCYSSSIEGNSADYWGRHLGIVVGTTMDESSNSIAFCCIIISRLDIYVILSIFTDSELEKSFEVIQ